LVVAGVQFLVLELDQMVVQVVEEATAQTQVVLEQLGETMVVQVAQELLGNLQAQVAEVQEQLDLTLVLTLAEMVELV
jgi:hypothetical protein